MEELKHECGVAMIRLLKPLSYYEQKYGTSHYALNKLYLLMEKQHNRGQEGAGIACVNLDAPAGTEYMFREKAEGKDAITEIFRRASKASFNANETHDTSSSSDQTSPPLEGLGEAWNAHVFMGHLRYSTTGKHGLQYVHPFLRRNNWRAKNLCLCGNFNMTNIDEVFRFLTAQGMSPRIYSDSYITLELMGHRLDREVERLYQQAKDQGLEGTAITQYIDNHVEIANVLKSTMSHFDGGYVMCGLTGSGEMFAVRDPWGIRPAYYYHDDEIVVVASERPVIQTTFDLQTDDIHELLPGQALIVHKTPFTISEVPTPPTAPEVPTPLTAPEGASIDLQAIVSPSMDDRGGFSSGDNKGGLPSMDDRGCGAGLPPSWGDARGACSFERIYFSRGSDSDIYQERKRLGEQLRDPILKAIGGDIGHTVFSYIPNTAEVAFYGMTDAFRRMDHDVRIEKVVWKDIKLRTFIADGNERNDLAAHVYDITYGSLKAYDDNLVIIDDSIVRGTTLRESIFKILDRLHPKKIVMVSSAPQIRYPDFYGIDMARLEELCAFRAAIALIKERGMQHLLADVYRSCKSDPLAGNHVRAVYSPFTAEEINRKMVEMLRPKEMQTPVELVFQSIEGLHKACPHHPGDWYFTGHYPTPGGIRLVNRAFVKYVESTWAP